MYSEAVLRQVYQCFAGMLEYPAGGTLQGAARVQDLFIDEDPQAAALIREFYDYAASLPPGRLEEVYTGTFDLDAACHPYVGYHLFGETYKRSAFLVELKERYQAAGFVFPANELPDHLAIMLHFLAFTDDRTQADEIGRDALIPVLDRMTGRARSEGFDEEPDAESPKAEEMPGKRSPFQVVLEALRSVLIDQYQIPGMLETSSIQLPSA